MSEIVISRDHGMTLKKARQAAEHFAAELAEEFDIDYEWEGNRLAFSRTGVSGSITVAKKHVEIRAKLGLMLMFLRGKIESEIHRFCDENFGPEA
jgi:putative polyhydroxyalkanoate system protein